MITRLVLRDLRNVLTSKILVVIFLFVLAPLLTALVLRESSCNTLCLWGSLGLRPSPLSINIFSWSWFVAPIIATTLFNTDIAEGMIYYILPRGVSRSSYLLSKMISLIAILGLVYCSGLITGILATILLGGSIDLTAVGYTILFILSSLPLALVSILLLLATGSMGKAILLAIGGWLLTNIAASMIGLTLDNNYVIASLVKTWSPFSDPREPPTILYSALTNTSLVSAGISIHVTLERSGYETILTGTIPSINDALLAILATAIWSAILVIILSILLSRRNF